MFEIPFDISPNFILTKYFCFSVFLLFVKRLQYNNNCPLEESKTRIRMKKGGKNGIFTQKIKNGKIVKRMEKNFYKKETKMDFYQKRTLCFIDRKG